MVQQMLNPQTFSPEAIEAAGGIGDERGRMTVAGVTVKSAFLLALTLCFGVVGWSGAAGMSSTAGWGWLPLGFLILLILSVVAGFRPQIAFWLGVGYAVIMGFYVGSISRLFDQEWDGIVPQALLATVCVFAVCLVLYRAGVVRVSAMFMGVVMVATVGFVLLYLAAWLLSGFGVDLFFWRQPTFFGVMVSGGIALLTALALLSDFETIERGVQGGAPKSMEWYAAFGLLATLIWMYVQILQTLAVNKKRKR